MENKETQFLPHLKDAVPFGAYGRHLCPYSISLEGWRRGLKITFFEMDGKTNYTLSHQGKTRGFIGTKSDLITEEADTICKEKHLTKEYLSKAGVSIPPGEIFGEESDDDEVITYANTMGYPLVLKPYNGNKGKGVFSNIQDETAMRDALLHVRQELNYETVIVERYIPGREYRVLVIGDNVIASMAKTPANVVGDGKNSIKKLIAVKNRERRKNPNLSSRLIHIDREVLDFVKKNNSTLESVPKKDEKIYLREKGSLSNGGDSLDYTDELSNEMKSIAINAVRAVPDLLQCGVDIMVDRRDNQGYVIELNSRSQIGSHLFPTKGQSRDIPKAIVDYYFPETKDKEKSMGYFDYGVILHALKSGLVKEITLPLESKEKGFSQGFIVSGKVQGVGYRRWIQKKARSLNLNGFAENLKNGNVRVVVSGDDRSMISFRDIIYQEKPRKAVVKRIAGEEWMKPVKEGFEVLQKQESRYLKKIETELTDTNKQLEDIELKLNKALEENKQLQFDKDRMERKHEAIEQSRMWRYTSHIRKTVNLFKKVSPSKT